MQVINKTNYVLNSFYVLKEKKITQSKISGDKKLIQTDPFDILLLS